MKAFGFAGMVVIGAAVTLPACAPDPAPRPPTAGDRLAAPDPAPSEDRPIALVFRRTGVYDLVFGGWDGTARRRVPADERTLAVAASLTFRQAAVLRRTGSSDAAELTFYDQCARRVRTARVTRVLLQPHARHELWVGSRAEALVVSSVPPVEAGVGVIPRPVRKIACRVKPDGACVEISDLPQVESAAFGRTGGFAVIAMEEEATGRRLLRYDDSDRVDWERRLSRYACFIPPSPPYELSVVIGSWRVHFRPDGSFAGERIAYDPAAFREANPGYVERAGAHYEAGSLPRAVEQLSEAADLDAGQASAARNHLRAFIYEWLDAFVRRGPEQVREAIPPLLERLDRRFAATLDEGQFARYLAWRSASDENALAFLLRADRFPRATLEDLVRRDAP